jgi:hypothetical protein
VSTGLSTFDVGECCCCTPICVWLASGVCGTCAERVLTLTGNIAFGGASSHPMRWGLVVGKWTAMVDLGSGPIAINFDPQNTFASQATLGDSIGNYTELDSSCGPLHFHTITAPGQFGYLNTLGVTDLYVDDSGPSVPGACGCTPCPLPSGHNVHLTVGAAAPLTMVYTAGTPEKWLLNCFDPGNARYDAVLQCPVGGGGVTLAFTVYTNVAGLCTDPNNVPTMLIDYTCSPLHLHFRTTAVAGVIGVTDLYIDYP